jgi:hypothetical protein
MVSIRIYIEGAGNANDDDELLPMQRPGETHLINKGDSISITTKIFALTTTY